MVAYCVHGHEVSQGVASALQKAGMPAPISKAASRRWKDVQLPTRSKRDAIGNKWVTREHPKIDRIACPWLVSRFVNPDAEFIYVPPNDVAKVAERSRRHALRHQGSEFGHVGDQCSFDAIVRAYGSTTAALDHLATIVRGADTSRPDFTPQCEGLLAISYGLSSQLSQRPRDAEARARHVRRALHLVPAAASSKTGRADHGAETNGTIEIPGSAGARSTTARSIRRPAACSCPHRTDSVEVIDHDAVSTSPTCRVFPEAAGVVADEGIVLVTNRGAASLAVVDARS